jgi:uncharacterized protein
MGFYWRSVLVSRRGRTVKRRTASVIVGCLSLALVGVAAAGPLEDAQTAEQRGDYATELALLRPLADQGNAVAQTGLGFMYREGRGVPQDDAQAAAWFRKAADQGADYAQVMLGMMYRKGSGVPQDDAQAAAWFRKPADQGDAGAQVMLGMMYKKGSGVPQGAAQAWFRKAADRGDADAQLELGFMYNEGRGVPQDDAQAAAWFLKAADQGNTLAQLSLGDVPEGQRRAAGRRSRAYVVQLGCLARTRSRVSPRGSQPPR